MSRSVFMTIAAVAAVIYGLGLVLAPATILEMHGVAGAPGANFVARNFGGALLGLGYMSFVARNAADSDALKALLCGTLVTTIVGAIACLFAVLNGVMNGLGWVPVIVDVLLAIGYFYFGCLKKA
jgi:hypothetical protein